jgi:predicted NUDIX family NTP pyrophosphohydrolase
MPKISAGLLMYRICNRELEVLLVHPGGPFWRRKDEGAWSIPKGEIELNEDHLLAAQREFAEETGITPQGTFTPLGSVALKSGKIVHAWAFEGDCNPTTIKSNLITIEWPPKSGKMQQIPEVDQAAFLSLALSRTKINPAQIPFLDRLSKICRLTNDGCIIAS